MRDYCRLVPILWNHGAGADVMKRIATPMIRGVITSALMELVVYPAIFLSGDHVSHAWIAHAGTEPW